MKLFIKNSKGVALTIVLIVATLLALISGFITMLGYNQRRLAISSGGQQVRVYYHAKAGMVDAFWRIRSNFPAGKNYANAAETDDYWLDTNADAANDVHVTIGARAGNGLRLITSIGQDN